MIGSHGFWRTDALWDCVKIGACSIFWRMRKIACVFTHAIWTVLLNNVCFIYFCWRMRKSHAIIRSEKIATHPIWMYPYKYDFPLICLALTLCRFVRVSVFIIRSSKASSRWRCSHTSHRATNVRKFNLLGLQSKMLEFMNLCIG